MQKKITMKNFNEIISLIIPKPLITPEELEKKYPIRELPKGAIVTRFAPSPTGFIHIGGIYIAIIAKNLASHSGGVYFIRIEDRKSNSFQIKKIVSVN